MKKYPSNQYRNRSRKKTILLVVLGVFVLAVAAVAALELTNKINLFGNSNSDQPVVQPGEINYNPPTEQEQHAADEHKESLTKDQDQPSNPNPSIPNPQTGSKKAVKPVIIRTGGGEVAGFVPGIVENGGTCTATFTNGSNTITKTSQGFANASSTNCTPISYAGSGVEAGWSVTLAYNSNASEGTSDASAVQ